MRLYVLVEGSSDVPTVQTILEHRFGLEEHIDFKIVSFQGKGELPHDPNARPDERRRGLLHQLPATLRGMAWDHERCIVVLVDADREDCVLLLAKLQAMLQQLTKRPRRVLFRIAIEEMESWFIADSAAILAAYPSAKVAALRRIRPDAVCGAWEKLAVAVGAVVNGRPQSLKREWAERILPHLDLIEPRSPSLRKFVEGVERSLQQADG